MTRNNIKNYFVMFVLIISASSMAQNHAFATPPTSGLDLGQAGNYAILSGNVAGVITNGAPGQFIARGNVGHTSTETPANSFTFAAGFSDVSNPAILGTITTPGTPIGDAHAVRTNIGTWDGTTNTGLACTFTFAPGAIDLSTDTTHGPVGQYGPGVYCIDGAASIGTAGINLNGAGPYVFKINGALTTVVGSHVTFNGATGDCNTNAGALFWSSTAAFSSAANAQFSGTVLTGPAAITTGANSNMTNARFISESAITIGGGANIFSSPPAISCGENQLPTTERMTGGGSVIDPTGTPSTRVTHGFELNCDVSKTPNNLEVNWGKGNNFHLTSLTSATCTDDPNITPNPPAAGFDTYHGIGTGTLNGVAGAAIDFTFTDAGEPGKNDHATIVIKDSSSTIVLSVSGNLQNGNQQAHSK
jgi:hypothetical protein